MKILFITVGPFSNVNRNLMNAFIENGQIITHIDAFEAIDIKSFSLPALFNLLQSILKDKRKWRQYHHMNVFAFRKMTEFCDSKIHQSTGYDLIFQTQTLFSPSFSNLTKPYVIYTDNTIKISERQYPEWLPNWSVKERETMYHMEQKAYLTADKIFTYNELIKTSFVEDYNLHPDKITCVGVGVNYSNIVEYDKKPNKTVLFVSTDFRRHGGDSVLKAFEIVKNRIKDARLIVVGRKLLSEPSGVTSYGFLDHHTLSKIYKESSMFVLPGKIGGVQALLEAMVHKCVCIVSQKNPLAFGIVHHGETGFLLHTNDVYEIARIIIKLLNEESTIRKIGNNSFSMVKDNFTWHNVAEKILSQISRVTNVEGEVKSNESPG